MRLCLASFLAITLSGLLGCDQPEKPVVVERQWEPNQSEARPAAPELRWTAAEIKWLREQLHSGIAIEAQDTVYARLDALGDRRLTPQEAVELLEPLHEHRIAEPEWQWLSDMLHGKRFRPCPVPDSQGHWIDASGVLPPWLIVTNKHETPTANSP